MGDSLKSECWTALIVRYKESFLEKRALCIVMDYADGGDLYALIGRHKKKKKFMAESEVVSIFAQICLAIQHVHSHKILHRDLKTQNVFLTKQKKVQLGDFGISRVLQNTYDCAKTAIGTPYYLSPEICQEKPYNHKSDVWSLGCILYEMLTLNHAFDAMSMKGLILKIMRGTYPPISKRYSKSVHNLVSWLLETDPQRRPSIQQVLCHPCIASKVTELQMLFPSNQMAPKKKSSLQKQYISEKPQRFPNSQPSLGYSNSRVYKSSVPSVSLQTPQVKKVQRVGKEDASYKRNSSNKNVSISEIEKMKKNAYLSQKKQNISVPNMLPSESRGINMRGKGSNSRVNMASPVPQKKNMYGVNQEKSVGFGEMKQRNFIKKVDRKYTSRVVVEGRARVKTEVSKKAKTGIDKSINDRKERINQLLSLYGKPKDTPKCSIFVWVLYRVMVWGCVE